MPSSASRPTVCGLSFCSCADADNTDTLLSGFEELLAVLREILEAIYGIELTDDDIGHAVQRWQRKQAIATGGFY